ncbi:MAG: hypothetical protein H0W40_12870 [Methylibium sp.]|uniref:hypothetical protein n=1 Tax=Methylibium sp. TaxID=2067992 RepID=UPI001857DA9F|nr:hypothetical protein [Methylibium sp.]MBA3598248.1 hypothetical protein [Methylibium sp.]
MKPKLHTFSGMLAAIVFAGGLSAAQAQTATPDAPVPQAPSTEQAPPSATQPGVGTPASPPNGGSVQEGITIDPDEAKAIMEARQMCSKATDPQAQQDCMNQAQQDYYRARSGGGGAGGSGSMQPGQGGSVNPHSPAAPGGGSGTVDPAGSPGQLPRQ